MNSPTPEMKKSQHRQLWWQLSILILVSTVAVYAGSAFDEQIDSYMPEQRASASVFNKRPSGMSGLSELTTQVGLATHPWLLPYRQLRKAKGMLVIISPNRSLADFEADQILSWVEAGNDLVYLDHFSFKFTRTFLDRLGLNISDQANLHEVQVGVDSTKPEFSHVPSVMVSADTLLDGGDAEVSYKEKNVFSVLKHGKGRILVGTAPNFCVNRRLSDRYNWSNFQFLINWMRTAPGSIMFDERCHGFTESANVFVALAKTSWGAVFAQLMLLLTVAVASSSNRFGAAIIPVNRRTISNLEFINGLSNAYRRAKANAAILEITGQALRQRICKLLNISPHEPTEKIIETWRNEGRGTSSAAVSNFLEEFDQALKQKNVSDTQFKALIATCDKISEQLAEMLATPSKKG